MKLQDKIIKLRKVNGWSQEDFAEKLNVSRQAVSRWENGTALPDAQNILQISKLYQVTTDYLLNDDYESDSDIPAVKTATEETEALFLKKKNLHLVAAICFTISVFCSFTVLSYLTQLLFPCQTLSSFRVDCSLRGMTLVTMRICLQRTVTHTSPLQL